MPEVDPEKVLKPKVNLSRLRDIGWTLWDPIGLLDGDQLWRDEDCQPFADEYDSYLLYAASRLRRGESKEAVAAYLASVEADYIGLGETEEAHERALRVVKAIKSDSRLWLLSDRN